MESAINLRSAQRLSRQLENMWQININNDELITRNIINIGPEGIAFKAPQRIQFVLGQIVKILVRLSADKSFECEGKVVWIKDQNYGVHFFKYPLSYDTSVMRAIHQAEQSVRATEYGRIPSLGLSSTEKPAQTFRQFVREKQKTLMLASTLDLILIGIMTAAFIAVAVVHEQNHEQESLAKIIEKAFIQKLSNH